MSHTLGIRQAQKLKTRQALMDAALRLLETQSLSSVGLREVTRTVGVTPTAFYRHFRDMADLGIALVEETLGSLHATIGEALEERTDEDRIDRSVELVAELVRAFPAHVRFVARERHGGVAPVRRAIGEQLRQFGDEVAAAFADQPEWAGWSEDDLRMVAGMYVDHMVMTASALLEAEGAEGRAEVSRLARRRLRLISLGRRHWLD